MTRVLLFVLIGITVIIYLLLFAVSKVTLPAQSPPGIEQGIGEIQNLLGLPVALPFAFSRLLPGIGTLLAIILVASSMGNEYNWRTIRTMLICSEGRLRLLGAKLISAGIFILIGMVVGLATAFVMSLLTTAIGGYAFDFSFATGGYWWDQFLQFWRTFYVIMPYALLGFLFAIVGRSAMPGIALGAGVLFLESIITAIMYTAGGWIAQIPDYLLTANVSAIANVNKFLQDVGLGELGTTVGFGQLPGVPHAFITLAIYSLVFLIVAFYLFRKRDVTG